MEADTVHQYILTFCMTYFTKMLPWIEQQHHPMFQSRIAKFKHGFTILHIVIKVYQLHMKTRHCLNQVYITNIPFLLIHLVF